MGDETTAPWVYDRVTKWWVDLSRGVAGLADDRYMCRTCRENLILRSARRGTARSNPRNFGFTTTTTKSSGRTR